MYISGDNVSPKHTTNIDKMNNDLPACFVGTGRIGLMEILGWPYENTGVLWSRSRSQQRFTMSLNICPENIF